MKNMRKLWLGALVLFPALAASPDDLASFEKVWATIQEKHYAPAELKKLPNGQSWDEVHAAFRPRIEKAQSSAEVRGLLREMIGLLGKSHYAISGLELAPDPKARRGGPANPGFAVDWVDGKVLVTRVNAGSEAARAGLRLGWELASVEGLALAPLVKPGQSPLRRQRLLNDQISGFHGEELAFGFVVANKPKPLRLRLPEPDGSTGFGFVQGMVVEREARRLGVKQDVAYFRLSMFLDAVRVLPEFERFVKASLDCRGFILDLRGNPGGIAIMANSLSGWFIQEPGIKLGTMYQRDLELNFAVIPRLETFRGPLAILIDGASASTSEILAGGLQNLGRAKVFGSKSAGAALPSLIEQLPNGDFFQYAVANYVSQDGKVLEGRGVTPDFPAPHTRASLAAAKDRALDAAINWIYATPSPAGQRP